MKVSAYQREDRDYVVYQGQGEVTLPSPDAGVRSRYGSVPLNVLPIGVSGRFDKTSRSEVPVGVVVEGLHLSPQEEEDPLDEFLWGGAKAFFFYSVFRWIWAKMEKK